MEESKIGKMIFTNDGKKLLYVNQTGKEIFGIIQPLNKPRPYGPRFLEIMETWKVYQFENFEYLPMNQDFLSWVLTRHQGIYFLKKGDSEDQLIEFQENQIYYENSQTKLVTFHDVSYAQKYERSKLEKQYKTRIMSGITQELKGPAIGVMGMMEVISQFLPPERKHMAESAIIASQWIDYTLNKMIDYSKVIENKIEECNTSFSIDKLLREVHKMFEHMAKVKNITIKRLDKGKLPSKSIGDERHIKGILFNLMTNAMKFTKAGGITITARVKKSLEKRLIFACKVQDTGIGIKNEAECEKIFEEGACLDYHKTMNPNGNGMGLFLSRTILRFLHGDIKVKSELGKGTTFKFWLPIKTAQGSTYSPDSSDSEHSPKSLIGLSIANSDIEVEITGNEEEQKCKCPRILIVDDNAINQIVVSSLLDQLKVPNKIVSSGELAKKAIMERKAQKCCSKYSLILMDGNSIDIGAFALAKEIQEITCNQSRMILLTSDSDMHDKRLFYKECGFYASLAKPLSLNTLQAVLARFRFKTELNHESY